MSFVIWRHPRPMGVVGRCIGRTDVPVDSRKAKRLAHRVRAWARREGGAPVVVTSSLARVACVGRWLRRWGWVHRTDPRLDELDFGAWDGRCWSDIGVAEVDAWCADFGVHAPGGGESVAALLTRCAAFLDEAALGADACVDVDAGLWCRAPRSMRSHCAGMPCVIGHAGWISAARWLQRVDGAALLPASWPRAAHYGERVVLAMPAGMPRLPGAGPKSL